MRPTNQGAQFTRGYAFTRVLLLVGRGRPGGLPPDGVAVNDAAGGFVAFSKCGDLLRDPVLGNGEVLRTETGDVVPLLVGHGHVQLHQVDGNTNVGLAALLCHCPGSGENGQTHEKAEKYEESL